jgi:hypothetical protein
MPGVTSAGQLPQPDGHVARNRAFWGSLAPDAGAHDDQLAHWPFVRPGWARRWPAEQVWKAVRRG